MGKNFDISNSILKQLPFFACRNIIASQECQSDISRYIYSTEMSCPPFEGPYSKHPHKWVKKSFIIRNALNKRDNNLRQKMEKSN